MTPELIIEESAIRPHSFQIRHPDPTRRVYYLQYVCLTVLFVVDYGWIRAGSVEEASGWIAALNRAKVWVVCWWWG